MTVSTSANRADFLGNGVTTAFTVPFYFPDPTSLKVLSTVVATGISTVLVLNSDYTVSGAGVSTGGTVNTTAAPASGVQLSVLLNLAYVQGTHYVPNDPFPAASHEAALDYVTLLAKQTQEQVSRGLQVPPGESTANTTLPTAIARANLLLSFDSLGNPTAAAPASGTATALAIQLASSTGASGVGVLQAGTGAVARTAQDKLRDTVSVKDFGAKGDGVTDDTAAIQAALTYVQGLGGGRVVAPQTSAFYLVSGSINVGVSGATGTTVYSGVELVGLGLPVIKSNNNTVPILNVGGVQTRVEGVWLQYTAKPANTFTNAVAIRAYNLAYSYIGRIYAFNVYGLMDMYQGSVAGTGANFAFSNTYTDLLCQQYSGWGIKMLPFVGGNSGSIWRNIYLNSNNNTGASGSGATFGGFWLQTCQNEVIELLNIEWQRHSGSAIVLNQCHNAVLKGIHFEGLYPTAASSPLIDILAGDGSCPSFESITITGCDWTGLGGANQGALFRLDSLGARVIVQGVNSYNNTTPANMSAVFNAGSTCYGSTIEFITVNDIDGSLSSDVYSPRIAFGTANSGAFSVGIVAGGTGYVVGDILSISGGTFSSAATVRVAAVSGGVVTGLAVSSRGSYSVTPSGTLSTTGGTGTGATVTATFKGLEYPLQRWNLNIAKHSALATDNVGGSNSTVAAIPGTVTSPAYDGMGLWDSVNKQFIVEQSGAYQVQVLVPTAASPVFQVKQNGSTVAGLTPPSAGGHDAVTYPFVRGDIIKITLASGSYTRTGVSFGISLAS